MKEPKIFLRCEHCGVSVRDTNMEDHLFRVHSISPQKQPTVTNKMRYWFVCSSCQRKSHLPTGTIRLITTKEEPKFHYHNEVKCRHCGNTDVHMGMKDWAGVVLRSMTSVQLPGEEIMVVGRTGFLEEKRMPMEEMMPFMESRISDEPDNWELWLRYGNLISGIMNDYEKATEAWERATKLNPKSIAPYMRLGETYFNRWKIYNEKGAKKKARDYLSMALVAIKENGDSATIENDPSELTDIVAGMINELGCANSEIYVAPMEEVAKPLSEHVSDNPNISMSRVEKSTGFMRAALINFIYEYPDVKKIPWFP